MYVFFHGFIKAKPCSLDIGGLFEVFRDINHPLDRHLVKASFNQLLRYVAVKDCCPLVDLRVALQNFLEALTLYGYRGVNNGLFEVIVEFFAAISRDTEGMNDSCQLLIIQVVLSSEKFLL